MKFRAKSQSNTNCNAERHVSITGQEVYDAFFGGTNHATTFHNALKLEKILILAVIQNSSTPCLIEHCTFWCAF